MKKRLMLAGLAMLLVLPVALAFVGCGETGAKGPEGPKGPQGPAGSVTPLDLNTLTFRELRGGVRAPGYEGTRTFFGLGADEAPYDVAGHNMTGAEKDRRVNVEGNTITVTTSHMADELFVNFGDTFTSFDKGDVTLLAHINTGLHDITGNVQQIYNHYDGVYANGWENEKAIAYQAFTTPAAGTSRTVNFVANYDNAVRMFTLVIERDATPEDNG